MKKYLSLLLIPALLLGLILPVLAEETTEASTSESTSESTTQATSESTSETTTQSTSESTSESTTQSTSESTTQSTQESSSDSTTESTEESITEPSTEPSTEPDTPPAITKDPTGESVEVGDTALFIAYADYYTFCTWEFVSPGGTVIPYSSIYSYFPSLQVSGGEDTTLRLSNIPLDLDSWRVRCLFVNSWGGETRSDSALILVSPKATQPTTQETTLPETQATEAPTEPSTQPPTEEPVTQETTLETAPPTESMPVAAPKSSGAPWWVYLLLVILILAAAGLGAMLYLTMRKPGQAPKAFAPQDAPLDLVIPEEPAEPEDTLIFCHRCGWVPDTGAKAPENCPECGASLADQEDF